MHRDHEYEEPRITGSKPGGQFDAIRAWHVDIQQYEVDIRFLQKTPRFLGASGFRHHPKGSLGFEQASHAVPEYGVIVDDHYLNGEVGHDFWVSVVVKGVGEWWR